MVTGRTQHTLLNLRSCFDDNCVATALKVRIGFVCCSGLCNLITICWCLREVGTATGPIGPSLCNTICTSTLSFLLAMSKAAAASKAVLPVAFVAAASGSNCTTSKRPGPCQTQQAEHSLFHYHPLLHRCHWAVDQYSFILEWPCFAEKEISFADLSWPHREAWSYNQV